MRLYIAEKPSLGRAIAAVLPKPHRKEEGCIWLANGDCVTWCIGHLLEQAEPDAYNPAYQRWQLEHLPIVPSQWQLRPKASARKQLAVLKKLIKQADELVHAGDPDREGQLLVDQVIDYLNTHKAKKEAVKRCLISDLNPTAVARALTQLRSNREFAPLSISALARTRADWLYGINMTRAYTLRGRSVGYQGLLSVGRVQTPILGLVVRRDKEIAEFVSKPFYEVLAQVQTREGREFRAKWQPSEACRPYMDEEGRVLVKALAENVVRRITGKPAFVTQIETKLKSELPPLPYNLSALQIEAAKRFGLNAKQVLDCCQDLYERHKLITYPRSDSRYLPNEHYAEAPAVIEAIAGNSAPSSATGAATFTHTLAAAAGLADTGIRGRAWNDSKVDAHHAIIPTRKRLADTALSAVESKLYDLIARQYLCQFFPKYTYTETRVVLNIEGGTFVAKARQDQNPGWKILFQKDGNNKDGNNKNSKSSDKDAPKSDQNSREPAPEHLEPQLPPLKKGEELLCLCGELLEKQTQPPKHFTDATLLSAMTGIARFVKDPAVRQVLKETDGLGTEATRAGILELLFARGFLTRQGKSILATDAGRGLIDSLPETATTPDMTAQWETALNQISSRLVSYRDFMEPLSESLRQLIEQSKTVLPHALEGVKASKKTATRTKRKRRKSEGRRQRTEDRS